MSYRTLACTIALGLAFALLTGCGKDNRRATNQCLNSTTSSSCNSCCTSNGAFGSVFSNLGSGSRCTCKGRR